VNTLAMQFFSSIIMRVALQSPLLLENSALVLAYIKFNKINESPEKKEKRNIL
jgi:hypothetical protein